MNIFSFIYLVSIYFLFNIFSLFGDISIESQLIFSSSLILIFGVPHGSLDNLLFLSKNKISSTIFYIIYLSIASLYFFAWIYWPIHSFIIFLIISAYHFGESQFSDYKFENKLKNFFFLIWGLFLMSSLLFLNSKELTYLTTYFPDTTEFASIYNNLIIKNIFFICLTSSILTMLFFVHKKYISFEDFFSELFQIFLIYITFKLFPIIIGFTLYFIFIHSFRSLYHEYLYLKKQDEKINFKKFIFLLIPHSVISYLFIFFIGYASYKDYIPISLPLLMLIVISVITLPHALVMSNFYNK